MSEKKPSGEEKGATPFIHESDNFISAYFGKVPDEVLKEASGKPDKKLIASLLSQLSDPAQKEVKDEVLRVLKNGNSQPLLVSILSMKEYSKHRTVVLAACWETGLDFSAYVDFFAEEAVKGDYFACLEAMTVITENMEGPFDPGKRSNAIGILEAAAAKDKEKEALFEAILKKLKES